MLPFAALAAVSCATVACALGLRIWWEWEFTYANPAEVRGWVWANHYPKHQETAAYLTAIGSVLVGVLLSSPVWTALAATYRRTTRCSTVRALQHTALALVALLSMTPLIAGPAWSVLAPFALTAAILAALALASGLGETATPARHCADTTFRFGFAIVGAIATYAFYYDNQRILGLLNLFEDGSGLAPLQEALRGGTVYRDSYLQHGLFHTLGKPLMASLFETSLTAHRAVDAIFAPTSYVALFVLGLAVFRSPLTAVVLAALFTSPSMSVSDRQTFGILSVAMIGFALRHELEPSARRESGAPNLAKRYYLAAGACTTLGFFYSTEIGLYSAASCGGFVLLKAVLDRQVQGHLNLAPILRYCAGAAATAFPFLAYFAFKGVLIDFAYNIYVQCTYQANSWGLPYTSLSDATNPWSSLPRFVNSRAFLAYFPPAIYLAACGTLAFRVTRSELWAKRSTQTLLILTLAALAWFRTTLGRHDPFHLHQGIPFLWVILLFYLESLLGSVRPTLRSALAGSHNRSATTARATLFGVSFVALLTTAGWILQVGYGFPTSLRDHYRKVVSGKTRRPSLPPSTDRIGRIAEPAQMVADLRATVRRIQEMTDDDDYIFDFTNQGSLYFLADRRSPWPYHQVVFAATPAMNRELVETLENKKPKLVVFESQGPIATYLSEIDNISNARRHPEVLAYLEKNYQFASEVAGTKLYLRNPDPAAK